MFTVAACSCKGGCGAGAEDPQDVLVEQVRTLMAGHFGSRVPVRKVNVLSEEVFGYPQVIAAIRARTHKVPVVAVNGIPYMSESVDGNRLIGAIAQALSS